MATPRRGKTTLKSELDNGVRVICKRYPRTGVVVFEDGRKSKPLRVKWHTGILEWVGRDDIEFR